MTRRTQRSLLVATTILCTPMITLAQEDIPDNAMYLALGGMALALGIVAVTLFFAFKDKRHKLEIVERLIQRGEKIPPELSPRPVPVFTRRRDIRRGIWLLCWGVGIGLGGYISSGQLRSAAWGLLFFILSAGSFVNALFFSGKPDSDPEQEKDA